MSGAVAAIIWRELLRFWHQRERFFAALVRPLVWLFIFGAGFRAALGLSIMPPYQTYILYETYIIPGLCAMIILFNAMQSSLSLVYDREMGSMRLLLMAPLPRWVVLGSKLLASAVVSLLQCAAFLAITVIYAKLVKQPSMIMPPMGYLAAVPVILGVGLSFGAFGLVVSAFITRLQNFAGVMNFIIFPMFFLSTALYPLWRLKEGSPLLAQMAAYNPFTYGTEMIRFALYLQFDMIHAIWVIGFAVLCFGLSLWGYDPQKSLWRRKME